MPPKTKRAVGQGLYTVASVRFQARFHFRGCCIKGAGMARWYFLIHAQALRRSNASLRLPFQEIRDVTKLLRFTEQAKDCFTPTSAQQLHPRCVSISGGCHQVLPGGAVHVPVVLHHAGKQSRRALVATLEDLSNIFIFECTLTPLDGIRSPRKLNEQHRRVRRGSRPMGCAILHHHKWPANTWSIEPRDAHCAEVSDRFTCRVRRKPARISDAHAFANPAATMLPVGLVAVHGDAHAPTPSWRCDRCGSLPAPVSAAKAGFELIDARSGRNFLWAHLCHRAKHVHINFLTRPSGVRLGLDRWQSK